MCLLFRAVCRNDLQSLAVHCVDEDLAPTLHYLMIFSFALGALVNCLLICSVVKMIYCAIFSIKNALKDINKKVILSIPH